MAHLSISSRGQSCRALFERLNAFWQSTDVDISNQVSLGAIEIERSRYDLWADNIAALQDAYLPSSLEYRIRGDANARKAIMKALAYLEESIQLALPIASGERPNETWDEPFLPSTQAGEEMGPQSSEIVELYLSIQEAITSLFRLSMIIRKKPETDEYAKAASRYQIDPTSDIIHVADKYPKAKARELPWLMERLGVAITRRRQYLLFRREHQERMLQPHRMRVGPDGNTIWSGTKASTYLLDEQITIDEEDLAYPEDVIIDPFKKRPRTEYADSSRGKDGASDFLRTPLLPMNRDGTRARYGEHFECPYCCRLQNVQDKRTWKKHVLSDLKPYVCTFPSCEMNMFDSQHDWFTHELNVHREQWRCAYCKYKAPRTRSDLISHIQAEHQEALNERNIDALLESCSIERIDATACPLCKEYGERLEHVNESSKCDVSLKQFQQHLGTHMQQLALAALPLEIRDGEEDDNDEESHETSGSTRTMPVNVDSNSESVSLDRVGAVTRMEKDVMTVAEMNTVETKEKEAKETEATEKERRRMREWKAKVREELSRLAEERAKASGGGESDVQPPVTMARAGMPERDKTPEGNRPSSLEPPPSVPRQNAKEHPDSRIYESPDINNRMP